jgi:hypothetical protein
MQGSATTWRHGLECESSGSPCSRTSTGRAREHLDLAEAASCSTLLRGHCHEIEPAPGAVAALNRLAPTPRS